LLVKEVLVAEEIEAILTPRRGPKGGGGSPQPETEGAPEADSEVAPEAAPEEGRQTELKFLGRPCPTTSVPWTSLIRAEPKPN